MRSGKPSAGGGGRARGGDGGGMAAVARALREVAARTSRQEVYAGELDMNAAAEKSAELDIRWATTVGVQLYGLTGTHATHRLRVRGRMASPAEAGGGVVTTPFRDIPHPFAALGTPAFTEIFGVAPTAMVEVPGYADLRLDVTTLEGAASTVRYAVFAFR